MKIYQTNRLLKIPLINNLMIIIQGLKNSEFGQSLKEISDISEVESLKDPVRSFVIYYITLTNKSVDENVIDYIVNCIYASKGTLLIFDYLKSLLSLNIKYEYNTNSDFILKLSIDELNISDVTKFMKNLNYLIEYILFYTIITTEVKKLFTSISIDKTINQYKIVYEFEHHNITNS